ncbi:DUF6600 domain-containing protein [Undibacterium sp. Ji83W]|uniref:DUF6600 domain-containing protein n=1 Tax=Undibacterium sp. Ji83W TaxID=3413043 RepID=UPI003BF359E4
MSAHTQSRSKPLLKIAALAVASLFYIGAAHAQDEPPGRVARVSYSYGNVSFADAGSNNWSSLVQNRPISTGDSLQVPYAGKAELHVGPNALRMAENTRMSFSLLDDDNTQIDLNQGSMVIRVRELSNKENFDIRTPNLVFSLQEPGEYRINVNDDNTTTVLVRRGTAIARGERDTVTIRQGEQSRFSGSNLQHTMIGYVPPPDTFDMWAADRDRAEENLETVRYVSREVIGYEQLDQYGAWETSADYGAVWYPRQVSATWAPYRDGSWVWVAPWGWTWVDRAPWGFAPYHYGRWAYVGTRWAWVPGPRQHHVRPVYAPALVAFVGGNTYVNNYYGSKPGSHPSVAWFPLGPGEVYRPGYSHNNQYIQRLNQNMVVNSSITNARFVNQNVRNAVTIVPTNTFVRGEHVLPVSRNPVAAVQNRQAPVVVTEAPNITPVNNNRFGEARQGNLRNGEQFRQRNLDMPAARTAGTITNLNPNEARPVNRLAEVNGSPRGQNSLVTPAAPANTVSGIISNAVNTPPANSNSIAPANNPASQGMGNMNRSPEIQGNAPRQYGNGTRDNSNQGINQGGSNYNQRPQVNIAPATPAVPATVNVQPNNNVAPPVNVISNTPPVRTPNANTPVNNAIMNSPNTVNQVRPEVRSESNDRSSRYGNGFNNNPQQENRVERQPERIDRGNERAVERARERPVQVAPVERPAERQVERAPVQAPMIQPAPQQAPRMEQRMEQRQAPAPAIVHTPAPAPMPAPAPRAMPTPAPAPAPAPRAEPAKEKDDPRNAKIRGLSER